MPRILIAPLDWGLGHATRCVPLIGELRERGCEVVLAADGAPAKLLAREFPDLEILPLRGYGIRYGKKSVVWNVLLQLPRILFTIRYERKWLQTLLVKESFDYIISDNRPGLHHSKSYCIYITHQLLIRSGWGTFIDRLLQQLHASFIKKFNNLWVPDVKGEPNLAGQLSHPSHSDLQPQYMGLLSRLNPLPERTKKYRLLLLISGPEPQRTILENCFLQQVQQYNGTVLLVRGLPVGNHPLPVLPSNITAQSHLTATQLETAFAESELVICRSGYTTLMDLVRLQKKAILIPTPGQTEQEYLARHMKEQTMFPWISQEAFQLDKALELAAGFPYHCPFEPTQFEQYRLLADDLLAEFAEL